MHSFEIIQYFPKLEFDFSNPSKIHKRASVIWVTTNTFIKSLPLIPLSKTSKTLPTASKQKSEMTAQSFPVHSKYNEIPPKEVNTSVYLYLHLSKYIYQRFPKSIAS